MPNDNRRGTMSLLNDYGFNASMRDTVEQGEDSEMGNNSTIKESEREFRLEFNN